MEGGSAVVGVADDRVGMEGGCGGWVVVESAVGWGWSGS